MNYKTLRCGSNTFYDLLQIAIPIMFGSNTFYDLLRIAVPIIFEYISNFFSKNCLQRQFELFLYPPLYKKTQSWPIWTDDVRHVTILTHFEADQVDLNVSNLQLLKQNLTTKFNTFKSIVNPVIHDSRGINNKTQELRKWVLNLKYQHESSILSVTTLQNSNMTVEQHIQRAWKRWYYIFFCQSYDFYRRYSNYWKKKENVVTAIKSTSSSSSLCGFGFG